MERPTDSHPAREIPPLRLYREEEPARENVVRFSADEPSTINIEDYWAGRNFASRRSARVAA